jgi:hypothetical protein
MSLSTAEPGFSSCMSFFLAFQHAGPDNAFSMFAPGVRRDAPSTIKKSASRILAFWSRSVGSGREQ